MKISIVVTHYKEKWDIVKPLFDSIEEQLGLNLEKDVEVIIVNDSKEDALVAIPAYTFNVIFINEGHMGVSACRNLGLDKATGEYVMFCDCDDRFISAYALHTFSKAFGAYDIIRTPFIEDQIVDGELKLIRHDNDVSFIHGKMYKREFLTENNLRFREDLTIHEDGYFNVIAHTVSGGKIHEMKPAVYLWKYNPDSIVRKDRELFIYRTYDHLMKCRLAICRELWDREYVTEYFQAVAKTVIDAYYDFQKPDALKPENKEIIKKAEKEFANIYKEIRDDYKNINVNDIAQMLLLCRSIAYQNGLRVEQETISEFLTRIVKEYLK